MDTIRLPPDFSEFLKLLNSEKVEYLLVGGYAVGYYGFPRATGDMDIWVASTPENAARIVAVLKRFGFSDSTLSPEPFLKPEQVIRMGFPPLRIELLTGISGVTFPESFAQKTVGVLDGVPVNLISLDDLKINKKTSGRLKDLSDLQQLQ
jgi:predicted nucleotidyltransferase